MKNDGKMIWIAVILGVVLFFGFLYPSYVTNRVIKELRMEYTPGPYAPGFDPDKVNPRLFTELKLNPSTDKKVSDEKQKQLDDLVD